MHRRAAPAVLAVTLLGLASPAPALDLFGGVQGGLYAPRFRLPIAPDVDLADDSWFVSPLVGATLGDFGLTVKYLHSPYELVADAPSDRLLGSATLDAAKHDVDVALRYRIDLAAWDGPAGASLMPFLGFRYERQVVSGTITFGGPASATLRDRRDLDFTVLTPAAGVTATWHFAEVGLAPFVAGTVFPWADVSLDDPSQAPVLVDDEATGFGGFAAEGGVSYSLFPLTGLPVSATASYRFQRVNPESFEEVVHQGVVGLFYHLPGVL